MRASFLLVSLLSTFIITSLSSQSLYFPPVSGDTWESVNPSSLGWCTDKIDSLYGFLEEENTKGFIVLKDGKIVLEKYFGTFTVDSIWYWASAGKTLTAFLVGKAQEEHFLTIQDRSADYLGEGWTNCSQAEEDQITIRHQLTMTSGLDDGVPDNHCTIDSCLMCLATSGTRWAYHNAPYTLLEQVLEVSTGEGINNYTFSRLSAKTGIYGAWFTLDYDNVFFSKVRNMARFGLLMQNDGIWNQDTLLRDTAYIHQMTNTSQPLNQSYGYLWWLNGKESFRLPTLQFEFPGPLVPNAPNDMIAGIGKNGQIVSISKSNSLVVVRMGNQANSGEVSILLLDQIWEKLNEVMCNATAVEETGNREEDISIFPNPAIDAITIKISSPGHFRSEIINMLGECVQKSENETRLGVGDLPQGVYWLLVKSGEHYFVQKFLKV